MPEMTQPQNGIQPPNSWRTEFPSKPDRRPAEATKQTIARFQLATIQRPQLATGCRPAQGNTASNELMAAVGSAEEFRVPIQRPLD
jgi:hypothetical protein